MIQLNYFTMVKWQIQLSARLKRMVEKGNNITYTIYCSGGLLTKEDLIAYKPKVYDRPLTTSGFFGNF